MRLLELTAIYPGPNLSKRAHAATLHPYLLRGVRASTPHHVWGTPITCIRTPGGWLYLVAFLDWHSRFIVAWELDQTMAVELVGANSPGGWEQEGGQVRVCFSESSSLAGAVIHLAGPQLVQLAFPFGVPF